MQYYKVKPEYDNFRLFHNGKYKGILIGNELLTEKEIHNRKILFCYGVKFYMFEAVEIAKTKTFFSFGARFKMEV